MNIKQESKVEMTILQLNLLYYFRLTISFEMLFADRKCIFIKNK